MKKVSVPVLFFFLAIHSYGQSALGMGKKWTDANLDTVIQHIVTGLGGGYGITDKNVMWIMGSNPSQCDAQIKLQKGYGIDRTVRRDNSQAINIEIKGVVTHTPDTIIFTSAIVAPWKEISKLYSELYKTGENSDTIYKKGRTKKLALPTKMKTLDEVVRCEEADPDHNWRLESSLAKHPDPWKPEMASLYGTEREKSLEDDAMSETKNPYFVLITTFKEAYGENISLYLQNKMKCALLKKTDIPTGEQFVFARNSPVNDAQKIVLTLTTDADKRVISTKITGSISAMSEMYDGFWPFHNDEGYAAKPGIAGVKTVLIDVVTYGWVGNTGYITVTKKPGANNSTLYLVY